MKNVSPAERKHPFGWSVEFLLPANGKAVVSSSAVAFQHCASLLTGADPGGQLLAPGAPHVNCPAYAVGAAVADGALVDSWAVLCSMQRTPAAPLAAGPIA